jgi:hypothetical protein
MCYGFIVGVPYLYFLRRSLLATPFPDTSPFPFIAMVVPVIISFNPLKAVRGSNIRQVRSKFVAELVESIRENGWKESLPTVYSPVHSRKWSFVAE